MTATRVTTQQVHKKGILRRSCKLFVESFNRTMENTRYATNGESSNGTNRYWIVKGRPRENDWNELLKPGMKDSWHTARPLKTWRNSTAFSCGPLTSRPGIEELRAVSILRDASFLKSGPATTILPLTPEQAELLYCMLCARTSEVGGIWPEPEFTH